MRTITDVFKVAAGVYLSLFIVYGLLKLGKGFAPTSGIAAALSRFISPA